MDIDIYLFLTKQQNTHMKTNQYRQGDVLLKKVEQIPSSFKEVKVNGPVILALGEVTGHHHSIKTGAKLYQDESNQATIVEVAEAMALLEHQEHAAIPLEKGFYEITLQREYHPEEIRRVVD